MYLLLSTPGRAQGFPQSPSVWSNDPDTTRRPSREIATQRTYDEARSSQKYSGRRNARSPSALSASVRRIRIYGIQNNALTCSSSTCRASLWRRLPARRVHRLCHCCRLWIDYSSCPLSLSIRYRHVTRHGSCSFGQPSGQSYLGSRWAPGRACSIMPNPAAVRAGPRAPLSPGHYRYFSVATLPSRGPIVDH